jgi:hypothetical protein
MLTVLLFTLSFSAASLALGSLIGSAIHYGGAWDALEAEARAGFARTITVTLREPRLAGGEVVWLPAFRPLAGRPTDGLRAAA